MWPSVNELFKTNYEDGDSIPLASQSGAQDTESDQIDDDEEGAKLPL